jgi:hypothetical protein
MLLATMSFARMLPYGQKQFPRRFLKKKHIKVKAIPVMR